MDPPSPDGSRQLSISAFILNIVLLYGFGVASFLIPKVSFSYGFVLGECSIH